MKHYLLKSSLFLICLACVIGVSSCGGNDSVTVTSTHINGPLGDFFEVVDKPYKIVKEKGSETTISVEIKRIKEGGPKDYLSGAEFSLELMDEDENVVDNLYSFGGLDKVLSLREGESTSLTFGTYSKIKSNVSKIRLSSTWDEKKQNDDEMEDDDEEIAETEEEEEEAEEATETPGKDDIPLTSKTSKVSGNLGSCFEVVEGTYNLKKDFMSTVVWVNMKRTGGSLPLRSGEKLGQAYVDNDGKIMAVDWTMHVYNDNGKEVATLSNYEDTDIMNKFAKSSSGTTKKVSFVVSLSDEDAIKQLEKGKFSIECNAKHYVDGRPE